MDKNTIQGLLIGIGVPVLLIVVFLPIAILGSRARDVYDQIPEATKTKYGIREDQSTPSAWGVLIVGLLIALLIVPFDWVQPIQELIFGSVLMGFLAIYSFVRAVHFGRLLQGGAKLPVAVVRYARYGFCGMVFLFVVLVTSETFSILWWLRA